MCVSERVWLHLWTRSAPDAGQASWGFWAERHTNLVCVCTCEHLLFTRSTGTGRPYLMRRAGKPRKCSGMLAGDSLLIKAKDVRISSHTDPKGDFKNNSMLCRNVAMRPAPATIQLNQIMVTCGIKAQIHTLQSPKQSTSVLPNALAGGPFPQTAMHSCS